MGYAQQATVQLDLARLGALSFRKEALTKLAAGPRVGAMVVGIFCGQEGHSFRSGRCVPRRLTERAREGPSRGEKRLLSCGGFGPSKANSNSSSVRYYRIMLLPSSPQRV